MSKYAVWGSLFLLLASLSGDRPVAAQSGRVIEFNIRFVNYCDGLDLTIRPRLGANGRHTGCGFNERVSGERFTTADDEEGVTVTYFDQTVRRQQRIDVYVSGFRAGNFYNYDVRTGELMRLGQWEVAPPAP